MKNTFSGLIACSLMTLSLFSYEDNRCLNDGFAIWGDAAFYRRNMGNQHHIINKTGGHRKESCKSSRLVKDFRYQPGFQVGMAYMTYHTILEAKYLWVREWKSSCSKHDVGKLFFLTDPTFTQDFFNADHASVKYQSQFQNGEVNYFYYLTPRRGDFFGGGWLVGIRYIHLTENLGVEFHKGSHESPYRVHVWNHIPAIQVGTMLGWNPTRMISWDMTAKVGVGFDCSRQHTYWGDVNNTVVLNDYSKRGFSFPLLVGASLSFTLQPWKFLNFHAVYEATYLNGIALAPDQINASSQLPHRIRTYGQALLHGATVGITFTF
jgi:hypothetical protein